MSIPETNYVSWRFIAFLSDSDKPKGAERPNHQNPRTGAVGDSNYAVTRAATLLTSYYPKRKVKH